ncbi:MAG: folate-binding protein [Pseudomonadota bacterium]
MKRTVLRVDGADHRKFLQDLVTNNLGGLDRGLVYAGLLTPQGKYLFDFFLIPADGAIWIDVAADRAQALGQRLTMYRLRADVAIAPMDVVVTRGFGPAPEGAFADPRLRALGWRAYGAQMPSSDDAGEWDALRVAHCVPETGVELIADQSYILECGFERLNGVDFRKGCYVGQEVTARMKHKTELKKGLVTVGVEGAAPVGTDIDAGGKAAGALFTQADGQGIAYLRFDRAKGLMTAGDAVVRRLD